MLSSWIICKTSSGNWHDLDSQLFKMFFLQMNNMCRPFSFCCHSRRGPEKVFPLASCHQDTKDRCGKLVFSNIVVMVTHHELRRRPECLAWLSRSKVFGWRKLNSRMWNIFKIRRNLWRSNGTYTNTHFFSSTITSVAFHFMKL